MLYYTRFNSQFWEIILVGNKSGLTNLHMVTNEGKRTFTIDRSWTRNDNFSRTMKSR